MGLTDVLNRRVAVAEEEYEYVGLAECVPVGEGDTE